MLSTSLVILSTFPLWYCSGVFFFLLPLLRFLLTSFFSYSGISSVLIFFLFLLLISLLFLHFFSSSFSWIPSHNFIWTACIFLLTLSSSDFFYLKFSLIILFALSIIQICQPLWWPAAQLIALESLSNQRLFFILRKRVAFMIGDDIRFDQDRHWMLNGLPMSTVQ